MRSLKMADASINRWKTFLCNAGIKQEFVEEYAQLFEKNRMQENMLEDITKDILRDIEIVAVGDILLITRHEKKLPSSPAITDEEQKKDKKEVFKSKHRKEFYMKKVKPNKENIVELAKKTLLSTDDVQMWLEHLDEVRKNRMEAAKKAAVAKTGAKSRTKGIQLKSEFKKDDVGICVFPTVHAKREGEDHEPPSKTSREQRM